MPIFSIEIDTDNLTCSSKVNGIDIDFDGLTISKYTYKDCSCCDEEDSDEIIHSYSVSYEVQSEDYSDMIRESFYWDSKNKEVERTRFTKMVSLASQKLMKKLGFKK